MTDVILEHGGEKSLTEMLVNNYFESAHLDTVSYLSEWANLRKIFPTLSGDAPPKKWFKDIQLWLEETLREDPSFSPVCFRFSTSVIHSGHKFGRRPEWDGTLEELSRTIMPLEFTSESPEEVSESYSDLMLSLVSEMLPNLTTGTLHGDEDSEKGESDDNFFEE